MERAVLFAALAALAAFSGAVACGSSQHPPSETPAAVEDAGPPLDAAPDAAPAPAATAAMACKSKANVCAEYQGLTDDDASKLKQQCTGEGGQVMDACPLDKVAGTCTATRAAVTVKQVVYRAKTKKETRSIVTKSKEACESKGGTFNAAKD